MYIHIYALDYCGNFADLLASRILVSRWRNPNSPYFGYSRDRSSNQARHGSRSMKTPSEAPAKRGVST
jgi:hypothetical protein